MGLAVPDRFDAWRDERLETLERRLREVATLASEILVAGVRISTGEEAARAVGAFSLRHGGLGPIFFYGIKEYMPALWQTYSDQFDVVHEYQTVVFCRRRRAVWRNIINQILLVFGYNEPEAIRGGRHLGNRHGAIPKGRPDREGFQ